MSRGLLLPRRRLLQLAPALALSACDSEHPRAGLLGAMERLNERLVRTLLPPRGLAPELSAAEETPYADYPQYALSEPIPLAPAGWTLRISGLVSRPLSLSLGDLQRLEQTGVRVCHHCVEGWSAVARWHGVRMSEIARLCGASPRAGYVEFRSFDGGYFSSWDRESALHPQSILAYAMNGRPLTPEHGAPVRLYAAVKLGYKMVKYLTEVRFLAERTGGYWEDQGYEWYAGV